jgi:serine/threonine protein kinase/WD40 repeat protein
MPSPQEREAALFALALEKPSAERAAFLDAICANDPALRARLDSLMAAHELPNDILATESAAPVPGTIQLDLSDEADERVGEKLGRYKLLEKVGEGGCGVVYVAEQTEPVRRRVALKVIKLGMDTKAVVARFEAERQALAMMDHPNIAKVLDAGATESGRPFFVMELVRGIRITEYCDQNNLSTAERLNLFIKVCQAIQHAHQKGIIHRDIKPSNILVTLHDGVPVPKVIDFGIAKATEGRLTDATVYTQLHQFVGTPAYMSPEQAEMSGLDIDTRSDIYSLGVLLYELLTGKTPFDATQLMASGIDAMRKTIREKEPVRPSTRLATLQGEELTTAARRRSVETAKLASLLKGDLDWVVMKCLEKDRTRRYDTANGLAMDLKRHLQDEPVLACPPSAAYRMRKAWHRNQLAFSAAIAVALTLLIGIVVSTSQAIRARRAELQQTTLRAEAVNAKALAEAAQSKEQHQRQQAEAAELLARRTAYASDMNLVQQALAANNLGRARAILDRNRPPQNPDSSATAASKIDLRGWEWRYLWNQARPDEHELLFKGPGRLDYMSIDPSGKSLAFVSEQTKVIDLKTKKTIFQRDAYTPAFAHRSSVLAFIEHSSDIPNAGVLVLWDLANNREVTRIDCPNILHPYSINFSPDDTQLITMRVSFEGRERLLTVWDIKTRKPLWEKSVDLRMSVGDNFAIAPDGSAFVLSVSGGNFTILEPDGTERVTVKATDERVTAVGFSPDSKFVLTGHGFTDPVIRVWDVQNGKFIASLEGHRSWVSQIAFSPDGSRLVTSSADQTVRIWKWPSREPDGVLRGHLSEVDGVNVTPGSHSIVSRCKDGSIYLWKLEAQTAHSDYRTLPDAVDFALFTPDSKSILGIKKGNTLGLWDSRTLTEIRRWDDLGPKKGAINISSDAHRVVINEEGGVVRVRDLQTGQEMRSKWPTDNSSYAMFTDNGKYIFAFDNNDTNPQQKKTMVMDSATGQLIGSFVATGGSPLNPIVPNLWGLMNRGTLELRDLSHLDAPPMRLSEPGINADFAIAPNQKLAALASENGFIQLYEYPTLRRLETLRGFLLGVHGVNFSPDGKRLAASSNAQEAVKLWDVETREEVLTLKGEGSVFRYLSFSPDGNSIIARNFTGICHIWTAPTWPEIAADERIEIANR